MNDWAAPPSADRVPTLTEVVDLAAPALDIGQGVGQPEWPDAVASAVDLQPAQFDAGALAGSGSWPAAPDWRDPATDAAPVAVLETAPETLPDAEPVLLHGASDPMAALPWEGTDAPAAGAPPVELIDTGLPGPACADVAFAIDTTAVVTLALAELQPRLDMLLESRLREALAPALARAAEGIIRDARGELASALNELLQDAVRRALQRPANNAPGADASPPHRP